MQLNELMSEFGDSGLWQPHSWNHFPAAQQPEWDSLDALGAVNEQIRRMPGLVGTKEIESLKHLIAEAGLGRKFILQGGDCAERFQDCREEVIRSKLRILMQMAVVMGYAGRKPIVPIGRMAGQYAKPRSEDFEIRSDGSKVPIFRGESINSYEANPSGRRSDPLRMLQAYHSSSATLNFVRMLMTSGFGDLNNIDAWDFGAMPKGAFWKRYEQIAAGLRDAMAYISQVGGGEKESLHGLGFKEFFVSHEALLLPYEQALTRFVPEMGRYYNLGTHMLWIGDRTRNLNGAHVEYCRGVGNPIGIKVSADSSIPEVLEVIQKVNVHNDPGKVTLITRLGADQVARRLPSLIQAVNSRNLTVTWCVDPMHGNTVRNENGRKTRRFESIVEELRQSFEVHRQEGSCLGGIHLEMTADEVTECTGGTAMITDDQLHKRYETWCDPRLNGAQSLEMAFIAASYLRREYSHSLL